MRVMCAGSSAVRAIEAAATFSARRAGLRMSSASYYPGVEVVLIAGDDRRTHGTRCAAETLTSPSRSVRKPTSTPRPSPWSTIALCYPRHRPISATARSLITAILAHAG
jgi:hypothetical protein